MNILYLHQYFTTTEMVGGTRSYDFARRLTEAGHRVRMLTGDHQASGVGRGWRRSLESGIEVHWAPVKYDARMSYRDRMRSFMDFAFRAARYAPTVAADVVFATSTPLTIAFPAVHAARRLGVPMVFEVRDLWPAVPIALGALPNPILRSAAEWLERFAYRNAQQIVALAPGMKEHIVDKGYPAGRVTVIPNGADVELFSAARGSGQSVRAAYPWLQHRRMLLYCGAIGKVNGVSRLAHIAAAAQKLDPEIRFLVLGKGPEEDLVRRIAADMQILDRNFFMLGAVPKREVPAWLDAADLAVALISGPEILWKNATQNKFFDALAAGKPILSNFRGWQSTLAEEAGAGAIFDADDAERGARQLVALMHDREWLERAGRAARHLAVSQFDRAEHARILESVLWTAVDQFKSSNGASVPRDGVGY